MAGRLLASGCAEAAGIEAADLVVINTCAIREAAEAKVIGRQGALAALKAANPALRVVLTGCAVRERDRAGLRRRFPAVDLFLRPDEEPELVERLGLASVQGPVGLPDAIPASPGTGPAAMPTTMTCSTCSASTAYCSTDRQLRSVWTTTLATLRWTNSSPGSRSTISLAGTRLSEQPIHR